MWVRIIDRCWLPVDLKLTLRIYFYKRKWLLSSLHFHGHPMSFQMFSVKRCVFPGEQKTWKIPRTERKTLQARRKKRSPCTPRFVTEDNNSFDVVRCSRRKDITMRVWGWDWMDSWRSTHYSVKSVFGAFSLGNIFIRSEVPFLLWAFSSKPFSRNISLGKRVPQVWRQSTLLAFWTALFHVFILPKPAEALSKNAFWQEHMYSCLVRIHGSRSFSQKTYDQKRMISCWASVGWCFLE